MSAAKEKKYSKDPNNLCAATRNCRDCISSKKEIAVKKTIHVFGICLCPFLFYDF